MYHGGNHGSHRAYSDSVFIDTTTVAPTSRKKHSPFLTDTNMGSTPAQRRLDKMSRSEKFFRSKNVGDKWRQDVFRDGARILRPFDYLGTAKRRTAMTRVHTILFGTGLWPSISWTLSVVLIGLAYILYEYLSGSDLTNIDFNVYLFSQLTFPMTSFIGGIVGVAYGAYRDTISKYRSGVTGLQTMFTRTLPFVKWQDISTKAESYSGDRYDGGGNSTSALSLAKLQYDNPTVRLANLYYMVLSILYASKHYFRGEIEVHGITEQQAYATGKKVHEGLPMPSHLREMVIDPRLELRRDMDASNDNIFDRLCSMLISQLMWFNDNGLLVIGQNITPGAISDIVTLRNMMGDIASMRNTPIPDAYRIAFVVAFIPFAVLHYLALFPMYGALPAGKVVTILIACGIVLLFALMVNGANSMLALFDDPERNPAITGVDIGDEVHEVARSLADCFEWHLEMHGMVLNDFDETKAYITAKPCLP